MPELKQDQVWVKRRWWRENEDRVITHITGTTVTYRTAPGDPFSSHTVWRHKFEVWAEKAKLVAEPSNA